MAYINRKQTEEAIRKYADQKHSNGEQIEYVNGILKSISVISEQPSAYVAEVKHGEWIDVYMSSPSSFVGTCSVCNHTNDIPPIEMANFCPHCGAKMDGGKVNDL